jgi:adenine phosphoribosyltransferase
MATLDALKRVFRRKATATASSPIQPLSDSQYSAGLDVLARGSGWTTYQDFVVPQLCLLLGPLFNSRIHISVLEVGPGPESVLGYMPGHLRQKIRRYVAFEPNDLFATNLEKWLCSDREKESPLPNLERAPDIRRSRFTMENETRIGNATGASDGIEKFDIVLFCHSMYGMKPKHRYIERALGMLLERPHGGMVVVFHRGEGLHFGGLSCHRTSSFPTGIIRVADDDDVLDSFSLLITGYSMEDRNADEAIRVEWRKICRSLGRREDAHPDQLSFSSPNIMVAFTQHATTLPELTSEVPLVSGDMNVKNRAARLSHPASIVRPTEIRQVQRCVQWALDHGVSLTVLGGGHSGHCLWSNVVSVDMGAFDQVHVLPTTRDGETSAPYSDPLIVAEAGCKSGDIIRKTMAAGLTVPLGARPSVGAGLWLQGGIGHLARLHGLACDAIVGAVVVSIASSRVLCIGHVPSQHQPGGAIHPENESEFMWALKGAGTSFGIVVSITFKAYAAPTHSIHNWVIPLNDNLEARRKLSDFDELIARKLPRSCSADAYMYWNENKLHLGVTIFETSTTGHIVEEPDLAPTLTPAHAGTILELEGTALKIVDGVDLFETEMYMSGMHGGHGGGKTSAFKRCVFLKCIGAVDIADTLVMAIKTRPSPLCYLHLLQGGGAVGDVADDATAFGCRDWDFACVVTGVWPRDQDETEVARAAVQWVYEVVTNLLPLSGGVYGADLGPDPRDALLAVKAFGPNRLRLARLKYALDPGNVLAYACPLIAPPIPPKVILLVTGESCAGKDYCAEIWCSAFNESNPKSLRARTVSISDAIKYEYAAATSTDLKRLLHDRAFKEQHRPMLSKYFQDKLQQGPQLLEEQLLQVLKNGADADVLLITGMRDEAPVASYSHLVPASRLLEVRVQASKETQRLRGGRQDDDDGGDADKDSRDGRDGEHSNEPPSLIFKNDLTGDEAAKTFFEHNLLPFFHKDLRRLANMVRQVPDFPRPGVGFRHVLDISQQPRGLALCISLLQTHFTGDWAKVNAVACCETGGFVYASALAARVDIPLALIREAGKLPPPVISVIKSPSHVSSSTFNGSRGEKIEIGRDVITRGASVVVVDDVFATGTTLCAVLQLLNEAGISAENITAMVVAEFPFHRGRQRLRQCGFGGAKVQSLLVFDGA